MEMSRGWKEGLRAVDKVDVIAVVATVSSLSGERTAVITVPAAVLFLTVTAPADILLLPRGLLTNPMIPFISGMITPPPPPPAPRAPLPPRRISDLV